MRSVLRVPTFAAKLVILFAFGVAVTGCSSLSNTEKGAAIGAGAGGAAGAIIGQRMDRQAQELEEELANAEVERVGEGIKVTFDNALLFDFDSAELRPNARANLSDLAESLQDYEATEVLIVGHTDRTGPEDYNQRLSERRASAAAAHLMVQGLRPSRVTTLGKGESEPVASNETTEGRQENRRVEVAIYASEAYRQELVQRYGDRS